jgi:hypothetical protein
MLGGEPSQTAEVSRNESTNGPSETWEFHSLRIQIVVSEL